LYNSCFFCKDISIPVASLRLPRLLDYSNQ